MPRISQEDKIVEAALQCFGEMGYEGTRIKHIAAKAGVAESALYRHFVSKEDIARRLFLAQMRKFTDWLAEVATSPDSAEKRLKLIAHEAVKAFQDDAATLSYILLQPPCFSHYEAGDFVSPLDVIARIVAEGQQAGQVKAGPPLLLAGSFVGCFLQPIAFSLNPAARLLEPELLRENIALITELAWAALSKVA